MSLCLQTVDTKVVLNSSNTVEQVLSWGRVGPSQPLNGASGSGRTCLSLCVQKHFGLSIQPPFHQRTTVCSDMCNEVCWGDVKTSFKSDQAQYSTDWSLFMQGAIQYVPSILYMCEQCMWKKLGRYAYCNMKLFQKMSFNSFMTDFQC